MAGKVQELRSLHSDQADAAAKEIGGLWDTWNNLRDPWVQELMEVRNFVFATDTSTTSVDSLGWKNKTTIPKICQIRDNLHANYISALFPNDNWVKWEGDTVDDETKRRKNAIESYISTKARQSSLRDTYSSLLYDYIDTGNAFSTNRYVRESSFDPLSGKEIKGYTGPKCFRIDPLDIVFNPVAPEFYMAPKIVRSIKGIGEIAKLAESEEIWAEALKKSLFIRKQSGNYSRTDWNRAIGYTVDGFGNLRDYYGSQYVEVLTFEGDVWDEVNQQLEEDMQIIVIDRSITVVKRKIPHPLGKRRINHVGWRKRPSNLYAMGPLANLVGMQYRIDHLENLKADALDLMVHPPLVIKGEVDPFIWEPNCQIRVTEDGDVTELGMNLSGVSAANTEIQILEQRMEEFAGAPKQAMGIRTPGEKTAFEVQALENAAGRIFQEKIENFEINLLEKELNSMLATAIAEGDISETVRTFNDELGVKDFLDVTTDDLEATGTLHPIGARHFGQQAQLLQNIAGMINGPMSQLIMPHISGKQLAKLIEDSLQLGKYELVRPYVGLVEQQEAQEFAGALAEDGEVRASTPTEPEMDESPPA
jgi:hypothetical protein